MNKKMQALLQPFSAPETKIEVITATFKFDLPKCQERRGIMIVLHKLSK